MWVKCGLGMLFLKMGGLALSFQIQPETVLSWTNVRFSRCQWIFSLSQELYTDFCDDATMSMEELEDVQILSF